MSENSQCWLSECDLCKGGQRFKPQKLMDAIVNYKQWKSIYTPVNSRQHQKKYEDQPKSFYKKLQVTSEAVPVGQVFDEFKQSFEDVVNHINIKQIQAKAFQADLTKPNTKVL